ncbi:ParA protein [Thermodesulfatator indicus DSM 15286]|uniref:ParA protein n=2 Tax=Thermodesulfatator indicus TaxID=171695 RepID=F8ABR7_THEID|nr:ParA protein [Thermodesulfatator indicus DSM 15286]
MKPIRKKKTKLANIKKIIDRQDEIVTGRISSLNLPKFKKYVICNLRGGIGKTTIAFNLSYLLNDVLVIDTCPQGNLSYFYDSQYFSNNRTTVKDLILPYILPGLGKPSRTAKKIGATNPFFQNKNAFYIPSTSELYLLPSQLSTAINQAKTLTGSQQEEALRNILYSLKYEIDRELEENNLQHVLIDTSPFFSGATHLSWHASDALIVPVRTDQQSINSLELLIDVLENPASEFRRNMPKDGVTPKIQLVILTHCTWSTRSGARNIPNQQTKVYLEKIRDIVSRNIQHFTTDDPDNHILLLDDFLGTGRISTALSKPVTLLQAGETMRINRVKTTVNQSVEKIKAQLQFIANSII